MNALISRNNYPAAQSVVQINLPTLSALIAGGLSLLFMIGEAAAEVPAIPEIPPAVAASNAQLVQQRAALLQERAALKARAAANKSECQAVKEKSAAEARCVESSSAISTDVDRHIQATRLFINNLDPMVVDTRNVPSGLPKAFDDAIPHTPAGDLVRKGFEAIQAGNWKVALASFQDARNKEPGNPGLGRLVDLAQFTLEYRTRAPEVEKNSAPVQSAQLPNQNSIPSSKDGAAIKPGAVEPGDNFMARVTAGQMAARARADAAYKQYSKKYGEHYSAARTRAVLKAYRGEGYTDEELKVQLQKSLLEYRKNYRKNHPNGPADSVGGSPAVEEISLGGKG